MCGCGRTSRPAPGSSVAGPIWSKKMNGPIVRRSRLGRTRWTLKPPRSWVEGSRVWRKGSSFIAGLLVAPRPRTSHLARKSRRSQIPRRSSPNDRRVPARLLPRRARLDRQRVDAVPQQLAERGVDGALAVEPGLARKGGGFDDDGEVAFAAAVVASMAAMLFAVVDHLEPRRGERGVETGRDFGGDGAGESACHRPYIKGSRE